MTSATALEWRDPVRGMTPREVVALLRSCWRSNEDALAILEAYLDTAREEYRDHLERTDRRLAKTP